MFDIPCHKTWQWPLCSYEHIGTDAFREDSLLMAIIHDSKMRTSCLEAMYFDIKADRRYSQIFKIFH